MKKTLKKDMKIEDLGALMLKGFERSDKRIDDVTALMVKGFEHSNKRIDDLAAMVARGFERVDTRFEEVDQKFKHVNDQLIKVRGDILGIGDHFVTKHQFDQLVTRFNVLEAKVKQKSK